MIHQRSQLLRSCFLLTDLLLTTAAWFLAYYLYFETGWFHQDKLIPGILSVLAARAVVVAAEHCRLSLGRTCTTLAGCAASAKKWSPSSKAACCLSLLVMATHFLPARSLRIAGHAS